MGSAVLGMINVKDCMGSFWGFVISSNTRCTGMQCLQLHDILPLPQDRKAFTMMVIHVASDAFVGTVAQLVTFFGICASKSGNCWMNLSSCWPTTAWLQLLLHQYQLIVACCNLFSCNGAVVLCMCWHVTIIVVITVIVIVKWHWRLDAFNGITTLIIALGVTLGVCSCVTRTTQFSGSTTLYQRSSTCSDISCV